MTERHLLEAAPAASTVRSTEEAAGWLASGGVVARPFLPNRTLNAVPVHQFLLVEQPKR